MLNQLGLTGLAVDGWAALVAFNPAEAAARLSESLAPGETLVLIVDQFEELVTLCADVEERYRFSNVLDAFSRTAGGRIRIVLTLRDDFLIQIQQLPAFRGRLSSTLQLLGTPAAEDLLRVVIEPAKRVGYSFDDSLLPRKMVDAVAQYPGALALLSFTAAQLWALRDRQLRLMRGKTYEALGGVGGALAHHAETTLTQLPETDHSLVREAFRQLVTSQGTRSTLSRKELLEVLGGGDGARAVVNTLVNARLLVASETGDRDDRIEIIHEALIVMWPRLVGWLREDAETARLRDALRASARQWHERNRPVGLLWRAEALAEYTLWRRRFRGLLTETEQSFAEASVRDEARSSTIRRGLALGAPR